MDALKAKNYYQTEQLTQHNTIVDKDHHHENNAFVLYLL